MKVLLDYDNVPIQLKRQGPIYVIDRVVTALRPVADQLKVGQLDFRLYGGWDENNRMSRKAQQLSADLRVSFPKLFISDRANPATALRVSAVLAQSLEVLPRHLLPNTLRTIPVQK